MNNKEGVPNFFETTASQEGLSIDYKRIIYRVVRYWYIVVLSVVAGLLFAFLKNRYSTKIYPVTASIIVKEVDNVSGAELLYNNPLINFKRNYFNEPYIIKSYPLIERVIQDLNFDVAFYREGNILTTETYNDFPVRVTPDRTSELKACRFNFEASNNEEFILESISNDGHIKHEIFRFGERVDFAGFQGVFRLKRDAESEITPGERLIFVYTPAIVLAKGYVDRLKAEWVEEGAGVINLSISGSNPNKESDFLHGLILRYQDNDLQNKNETASRTVKFISDQLEGITDSLRRVEGQLERFKDKNVVTDLSGEALRLYQKIEELEAQRAQLTVNSNYYKYLIEYIERNQDLHQIILPSSVGINDPILSNLVAKMNEIQLDIKMSGKERNPLVVDALKRINQMKKDIVESVRNQESTDKIKADFVSSQIKQIEEQLSYLPIAERTLISIQRNYSLLENLYIFLLQKKSEAAISQASNTSDIMVVNPPLAGIPISPRPFVNYAIGLMLGLALPIFVFIGFEVLNKRIQSKDDIQRATTIPFIGGLGHNSTEKHLVVLNQPKSALAESFRSLRSNLNYFIGQREKAVFMITSSISGEGKSFTSLNLASIFALSNKKTLIVGADMRKPKLFGDFMLNNAVGLSSYLANLQDFDHVVQKTKYEHLDLISGGPVPPNPSELLLTNRMSQFIAEAKIKYDYIIIDTPPLAIVTDAFMLAKFADHSLFVVRQNYTSKDLLTIAEEFYSSGKLKNISIVLNDINKTGPGYGYGYAYGYGYGYGYGNALGSSKEYYEQ